MAKKRLQVATKGHSQAQRGDGGSTSRSSRAAMRERETLLDVEAEEEEQPYRPRYAHSLSDDSSDDSNESDEEVIAANHRNKQKKRRTEDDLQVQPRSQNNGQQKQRSSTVRGGSSSNAPSTHAAYRPTYSGASSHHGTQAAVLGAPR